MSEAAVGRRLERHAKDIRSALNKRSKYGKQAEAMIRESTREGDSLVHERNARNALDAAGEFRAFGTDGGISATAPGEASAFVPPAILLKAWAAFRTPFASFANACKQEPMPDYGLELYVPHITGTMEVTSQTENSGVALEIAANPAPAVCASCVGTVRLAAWLPAQPSSRRGPNQWFLAPAAGPARAGLLGNL